MEINFFLLILVGICAFLLVKKRTEMINVLYIILMAIPIGSTNILLDKLDVIVIKGIGLNLIHFIIGILALISLKDILAKMREKKYISYGIIGILLLILISLVIGFINDNSIIQDGQKFLMFLIWGCVIWSQMYDRSSVDKFIYITIIAININFCLNILLNIMRPITEQLLIADIGKMSEESGFVSYAANISLVTIAFSLYYLLNRKMQKKESIIFVANLVLSALNNIIFAGNRTYMILMIALVVIVAFSSDMVRKQYKKNKYKVFVVTAMSFLVLVVALLTNDTMMRKITNAIQNGVDINLVTRGKTISYYMKEIIVAPFGYGFGKPLPLINQFGRFHGSSLFTDNAFLNVGMKIGLIGLIVFIAAIVYIIKRSIVCNRKIVTITYVAFLISGALMTGQIFNNYPMSFFFIAFSILCIKGENKEHKKV